MTSFTIHTPDTAPEGYSRRQVIEVIAFISHKTLSNYLNHLAETPLDEAFAPLVWTPEPARV